MIFVLLLHLVRVFMGLFGFVADILGGTLFLYLTIMVHSDESSTYRGAKIAPRGPCSGTPQTIYGYHTRKRGNTRGCAL
jgi:hypothetical protein